MNNPDMTGMLFRSKSENPRAPVLSGFVVVNGEEIRVAGWYATDENDQRKLDKNGNPYLKLKLGDREQRAKEQEPPPIADEDLPF